MYKSGKTFGIATYQPVSLLTPFQNFFILRAVYRGKPRGLNPPPAFYVTLYGVIRAKQVTITRYALTTQKPIGSCRVVQL